jgi:hypothetical protein
VKIKDLNFDKNNYNNGNEFGNSLIEKSLRSNGAGRSILLDKNNNIIAGNKTAENAGAIGLDDVIIVDSDGTKLIAVRRTDIDIHSKQGKELALADNATSKANITWNHEALKEDWGDDELKAWGINDVVNLGTVNSENDEWVGMPDFENADKEIKCVLIFNSELDRETFASVHKLKPTHKQAGTWTIRF